MFRNVFHGSKRFWIGLLACSVACLLGQGIIPVYVNAATFAVSTYGAVPNDTLDDGLAIRAAVDEAVAAGAGSIVSFASGEYRMGTAPDHWEYNTADDQEGWIMENQVSGTVSSGMLNLSVSGSDPYIKSPDHLMANSGYLSLIYISMKNNTSSTQAKIEWIRQDDITWNSTKSYTFSISANDTTFKTYAVLVNMNSEWKNTIRQIRIHPEEGASTGTVNIDYVRLGATSVQTIYNFKWDGNLENWVMQNHCSGSVAGGSLQISITGTDPYIISPDNLDFNNVGCINVRMKNNTADTAARVYYITTDDTTWNQAKSIPFTIHANDTGFSEYNINLYSLSALSGKTIKRIRIDPIDSGSISSGTVDIDSITIQNENRADRAKYAIRVDGSSGITLQGVITDGLPQTTLMITDILTGAISLNDNNDLEVKGFIIDYLDTPYTQGTITSINTNDNTFDFQPDTGYATLLNDSRFTSYLSNPRYGSFYGFARNSSNPELMLTTGGDAVFFSDMMKVNSTTWRFTVTDGSRLGSPELVSGTKFVITPRAHGAEAISLTSSSAVLLDTINIYASPEAGVIAWKMLGDFTLDKVKLLRKPSSTRWLSTNADGFHFQAMKSGAIVQNSHLQGCGDDLLNFYTIPNRIVKVISSTKIAVESASSHGTPEVGDTIQIYDPQTGSIRGTTSVASLDANDTSGYAILNLSSAISGMVAGTTYTNSDAVYNLTYDHPDYSISNSIFEDGRRYGLYLKAKNGTVQDCTFEDLAGAAIICENEFGSFTEGPAIDGLTISGCTITNCGFYRQDNYQPYNYGIIKIMGSKVNYLLGEGRSQKNITISGNTINHVNAMNAIYIGAADNVNITNNTINGYSGDYVFSGQASGILIENSKGVSIDGLRISDTRSGLKAGIQIGETCDDDVEIGTYNAILDSSAPNILKEYKASTAFDNTQGPVWLYFDYNGSSFEEMTYNTSGYWQGRATWTRIYNGSQHPDTGYDSVLFWFAPGLGDIDVTAPVSLAATGGNGVVAKIWKNGGQYLWSQTITSTSQVNPTGVSNISINQGDCVNFIVNNNGDTAFDSTYWDPLIAFKGNPNPKSTVIFKASDGFSGTLGRNQWFYEKYSISAYSNMGTFDVTGNYWKGDEEWTRVYNNFQHPGNSEESVRTWKAPYNAAISITGSVSVNNTNSNGVVAAILKNTDIVWQATVSGGGSASPTGVSSILVNAGDVIRFKVGSNGSNSYDATDWDPVLTVTER